MTATDHMIANVNVEETASNLLESTEQFYKKHREGFLMFGVMIATLWASKRSLRSELKRLNFNVEVFPDAFSDIEY